MGAWNSTWDFFFKPGTHVDTSQGIDPVLQQQLPAGHRGRNIAAGNFSKTVKTGSLASQWWRGGLSALTPMEANPNLLKSDEAIAAREHLLHQAKGDPAYEKAIKMSRYERYTTKGTRSILRGTGRLASKWMGPLFTGYRLSTEVGGQGFAGGVSQSARIIGEEFAFSAGMTWGMGVGTSIGGWAGGILGSIVPGAGTIVGTGIGMVAGAAIGMAAGYAGQWAWNRVVDVAEAPFRIASQSWKYLRETGRHSSDLELGGGVSAANRSGMAYTMRQRALSEMNRSGINARSLLGQESSYLHIR